MCEGIKIVKAESDEEIRNVSALADRIWHEHYADIIGAQQVDYMMRMFQSEEKIMSDIRENGYIYYIALENGRMIGYCGIRPDIGDRAIFLSKLYVEKGSRGKGMSRIFIDHFVRDVGREGYDRVWLTVAKENLSSIAVYEHLGFEKYEEYVLDIGGGFVMDDFKMRMRIES